MPMRFLVFAVAIALAAFGVNGHAATKPDLGKGLTIPELIAGLEAAGYQDFDSVQSDQRRIVVQTSARDGTPVTIKYWPETGRTMVSPRSAARNGSVDPTEVDD